jgi:hypothetical protein
MTVSAPELEARLATAHTEAEFDAVAAWMVSEGMDEQIAEEHVSISRLVATGQRLPDTPDETHQQMRARVMASVKNDIAEDQWARDHGRFAPEAHLDPSAAPNSEAGIKAAEDALANVVRLKTPIEFELLDSEDSATMRMQVNGKIGLHDDPPYNPATDTKAKAVAAAVLHEVGHYIDRWVLGDGTEYQNYGDDFYQAARRSPTVQKIINGEVEALAAHGGAAGVTAAERERAYYAQGREMFARAFYQWVAEQSDDPIVRDPLDKTLSDSFMSFTQWPEEEFAPIRAELEKVLRKSGTIKLKADASPAEWAREHGRFAPEHVHALDSSLASRVPCEEMTSAEVEDAFKATKELDLKHDVALQNYQHNSRDLQAWLRVQAGVHSDPAAADELIYASVRRDGNYAQKRYEKYAQQMDESIDQVGVVLDQDTTFLRGVEPEGMGMPPAGADDAEWTKWVGSSFEDPAYASVAVDEDIAGLFTKPSWVTTGQGAGNSRVAMVITAPKGTKAMFARSEAKVAIIDRPDLPMALHPARLVPGQEAILPRGMKFRITSVGPVTDGTRHIGVEVIG